MLPAASWPHPFSFSHWNSTWCVPLLEPTKKELGGALTTELPTWVGYGGYGSKWIPRVTFNELFLYVYNLHVSICVVLRENNVIDEESRSFPKRWPITRKWSHRFRHQLNRFPHYTTQTVRIQLFPIQSMMFQRVYTTPRQIHLQGAHVYKYPLVN